MMKRINKPTKKLMKGAGVGALASVGGFTLAGGLIGGVAGAGIGAYVGTMGIPGASAIGMKLSQRKKHKK